MAGASYELETPAVIAAMAIGVIYFIGVTFLVPLFVLLAADDRGPDGILGLKWYRESPRTACDKVALVGWILAFILLWPLFLVLILFRNARRRMDKNFGRKRREPMQATRKRASADDVESASLWTELSLD